jgi:hypothetical protein
MSKMALSWSRISDYRQCPGKFRMKYITKEPNFQLKDEDKGPHLVRGGNVHKQLDNYVVHKLQGETIVTTLPEVVKTTPLIDQLMANYTVNPEKQIAIDENFKEVSWYAKDAYFRVIYDLVGFGNDLLLIDWKTGKFADYGGSMEELGQLHFSALVGMALWPEYEKCNCVYVYVDHGKTIPVKFDRDDLEPMKEKLIVEHAKINADEEFFPRKNRYCGWCDAMSTQCQYSKK